MTIPLDRLRDFALTTPGPGQIALAVARHEAAVWPSPQVDAYARHRAQLIHDLVDRSGMRVVSWGETDMPYPREVVEVILEAAQVVVPSVAQLLAAWFSRPPKTRGPTEGDQPEPPRGQPLLPGVAIKRPDGAELTITSRDGLSPEEIGSILTEFMGGAGGTPRGTG